MEIVKTTDEYTIIKKRSGRYGVKAKNGQWVNGAEKVKILVEAGLVKAAIPVKEEPAPVEEAPVEAADGGEETPAEEAAPAE